MDLFYRDFGKGSPIMFIHGLYGCSDNWLSIAKHFSINHRLIIPDLRNHGKSFHSNEFSYDILTRDIISLLDSLNISKISIIGHSMGGKIAMAIACQFPHLIDKLIIVDIAPVDYNRRLTSTQTEFHASVIKCFNNIEPGEIHSYTDLYNKLDTFKCTNNIKQLLAKNLRKTKNKSFEWKLNFKAIESNLSNILGNNLDDDYQYSEECSFIRGDLSDYVSNEVINTVNNFFPKATIQTIPKTGHWIHSEQPNLLVEAIKQALL